MSQVQLAVVDVDGCLTPGEGRPWNSAALDAIADFNRRARAGEPAPAVTLCTGRQEPYVEALMQAIDAHLPGIYENGGGLYFPRTYRFAEHPAITPAMRRALGEVRRALQREVVDAGLGYFQPGKEVSLSLYPLDGISVPQLHRAVAEALAEAQTGYVATASVSCVDVLPQGIDKGAGVRWLADVVGVPLARIGGIGDSTSDLAFLSIVGFAAAPANATDEVRAAVDYVSLYEEGEGVVDILHRWQGAP